MEDQQNRGLTQLEWSADLEDECKDLTPGNSSLSSSSIHLGCHTDCESIFRVGAPQTLPVRASELHDDSTLSLSSCASLEESLCLYELQCDFFYGKLRQEYFIWYQWMLVKSLVSLV
jgi:hypothetical protein